MLVEAGNQPMLGRHAVGLVIINRAEVRNKSVCAVIKQRGQFPWYKGGKITRYAKKDSRLVALRFEAHDLLDEPSESKAYRRVALRNATYFHATYVKPKWAKTMCNKTRVKDHYFYTECRRT
jgi:spore germination cell wall hydrolase CwlJ-like protein